MMVTVSLDVGQTPLLIVQTKVFVPTDRPVTPEPGAEGVVTIPLPAITVHAPVPTDGVFPARVEVGAQTA